MNILYTLINIFFLIAITSFILATIECIFIKENFISDFFIRIKNLNLYKKIIFFIILLIIYPVFHLITILNRIRFFVLIIITILISFSLKVDISRKIKKWRTESLCINYNESYYNILLIIIKDWNQNQYNISYDFIYSYIAKKKKNYIKILQTIGFLKITGFSKNYVENVLSYTEFLDFSIIKKNYKIKLKMIMKRICWSIIFVINKDYNNELYYTDSLKIKIEDYKIKTNGSRKFNEILANIRNGCKIIGQEKEKNNDWAKWHTVIKTENLHANLTSGKVVRLYDTDEKIESTLIGRQVSGRNQYMVQTKKGDKYHERYEFRENLNKEMVDRYDLRNNFNFIGLNTQIAMADMYLSFNERIVKDKITKKEPYFIKEKINITDDEKEELLRLKREDLGKRIWKEMEDIDKFNIEKNKKELIKKWENEKDYYDKW